MGIFKCLCVGQRFTVEGLACPMVKVNKQYLVSFNFTGHYNAVDDNGNCWLFQDTDLVIPSY